MKNKIVIIMFFLLTFAFNQSVFAKKIPKELKNFVKNIEIYEGVEVIVFNESKYIISVSSSNILGSMPKDKIMAMKIAKQISDSNISKFVNGEDINIKESLKSMRITRIINDNKELIKDEEIYNEFIKTKSSGALKYTKNIRWRDNDVYFVATLLKLK